MRGLLISILLLFALNNLFAQNYSYSYIDPCTGKVKSLNIPTGSNPITVNYYGAVSQFNANDFNNGNFAAWINNVAAVNSNKPCGEVVTLLTTNINMLVTQNIVSTVMNVTSIANMAQSMSAMSSGMSDGLGNSVNNSEDGGGQGGSKKDKKNGKNNNSSGSSGSSSDNNSNSGGQPNNSTSGQGQSSQGQGSQINSNNGNGSQSTGSNGTSTGNGSTTNGNGNTAGSGNGNGQANPSGSGQGSVGNNSGSSNPTSGNTASGNQGNPASGTPESNGGQPNSGGSSPAGTTEPNNTGSTGTQPNGTSGTSSSGGSNGSGSTSGNSNGSGSGSSGSTTASGGSGSNGAGSTPPNGQENNTTTKSSSGSSNGISNSISNAEDNSGNGGSGGKGNSRTRTGSIIGTGDIVALRSAEDPNARDQFRFTASLTHANTKNTRVSGLLCNYTTDIRNSNLTVYKAWVIPKSQWTVIAANSSMMNFERDFFNTTTTLASKKFNGGWKKLTVMAGLNYTLGNLGETRFGNLSAVGGGFYSYNIGKKKKISGSILCLAVYSPFTQFFEGQWWQSGTLIVPFNSWDYSITKKFKFNISISGVYQVNQNMLNYQILTGGKMLL